MRAVVDTNILIRALIKPDGTVGPILTRLAEGDYALVYSAWLLDALLEKLALPRIRDKYSIDADIIEGFLSMLALRGEHVVPIKQIQLCRDPDDDHVLETALAGATDYIVTSDSDLLDLNGTFDVPIVTSAMFLLALDELQL